MDPTWPAFPILAFISLFLVLIPLPWHLGSRNVGAVMYILWSAVATLNQFVNSIVWHDNVVNWSPIWCDISTRIIVGASVGVPASALCIVRRLYHVASTDAVLITSKERNRAVIVDLGISLVLPLICIPLGYIVDGHRFNIFEDYGCLPAVYNSLAAYFLTYQWPLTIGVISMTYCLRILYILTTSRARFYKIIAADGTITVSRYFRLMGLALIEMLVTVPIATYVIYNNAHGAPLRPWISWENVHVGFSAVVQYPRIFWESNQAAKNGLDLTRWTTIVGGYVFFFWFGCAEEAKKNYRNAFWRLAIKLGFKRPLETDGAREGAKTIGFIGKLIPKSWSTSRLFATSVATNTVDSESCPDMEGRKGSFNAIEPTASLPSLVQTNAAGISVAVNTQHHTDDSHSLPPGYDIESAPRKNGR